MAARPSPWPILQRTYSAWIVEAFDTCGRNNCDSSRQATFACRPGRTGRSETGSEDKRGPVAPFLFFFFFLPPRPLCHSPGFFAAVYSPQDTRGRSTPSSGSLNSLYIYCLCLIQLREQLSKLKSLGISQTTQRRVEVLARSFPLRQDNHLLTHQHTYTPTIPTTAHELPTVMRLLKTAIGVMHLP